MLGGGGDGGERNDLTGKIAFVASDDLKIEKKKPRKETQGFTGFVDTQHC